MPPFKKAFIKHFPSVDEDVTESREEAALRAFALDGRSPQMNTHVQEKCFAHSDGGVRLL